MHGQQAILELLTLVGVTVLGPVLATRLRVPTAVLLILLGLAVGPVGAKLVAEGPVVAFLSELGFMILMFIAGMEIDFTELRSAGARAFIAPSLIIAGIAAGTVGLALWLGLSVVEALIISALSVGMPLAVLQETGTLKTELGSRIMMTVSLGEFVSIVAVIAFEMSVRHGVGLDLVISLAKVAGLFIASVMAIRWARALVWWYPEAFQRFLATRDVAELGVRVGLLIMLAFVMLSGLLHVEAILGAFIAGLLVAFVLRERHTLEHKLTALGQGLFIPVFFVVIGVRFDPRVLDVAALERAGLLIGAAALAKLGAVLLFMGGRQFGVLHRIAAGCLFASPLTLVVAIGTIGQTIGVLEGAGAASVVVVAIAPAVVFPILYKLLVSWLQAAQPVADKAPERASVLQ